MCLGSGLENNEKKLNMRGTLGNENQVLQLSSTTYNEPLEVCPEECLLDPIVP